MTIEQFTRAKEIESELTNIQGTWWLANSPGSIVANADGSPCDREEALEGLRTHLQERADRLKKEFEEL